MNNKKVINKSLEIFALKNIDYMDSLLCAYNHVENVKIETFDKKLKKNLKIM